MNSKSTVGTSADELKLAGRRFRWLFHHSSSILAVVSVEGRITTISDSVETCLGYSPAELLGRFLVDYFRPNDQDKVRAFLMPREDTASDELLEVQAQHRDGTPRFLEMAASNPNAASELSGILITARDISGRKDLQKQLLRAQRLETIGSLAGGVAHDLNNILAPVLMGIELLRTGIKDPVKLNMLQVMESSLSKGRNIVKQVLTFARGVDGEPTVIDPRRLINDVVEIVRQTFSANISIRKEISEGIHGVLGDATQIHQVLMNLLVNARDALPQGGSITVTCENLMVDETYARMTPQARPGSYVVMEIADTGTGIPAKDLRKIFTAFFTTKGPDKGTGLGLSTVKQIVEGHGGYVTVESKVGNGTVFRVHLPANSSAALEAEKKPIIKLPAGNGELVIVADDDASVRDITKQTLEAYGYVARVAADGAEALALLIEERAKAKILFTDYAMPIMDGRQLISAVRKMGMTVKIIVASGTSMTDDERTGISAEADALLSKPFTAGRLLTTLHQLLPQAK